MKMTRNEMLRILVSQARRNGFEFRKWFEHRIQAEWPGADEAFQLLCSGSRYYALLFSHEFAVAFWKQGEQISFVVPGSTYTRRGDDGSIVTVNRKPFTRRTLKPDAWKYHLREMAAADDPLAYIRRFLPVQEDVGSIQKPAPRR